MRDDERLAVKYGDGNGVCDGKFVHGFDKLHELHAECQDFGVIDALKELLKLCERYHQKCIGAVYERIGIVFDQVDCVASDDKLSGVLADEVALGDGRFAVAASVTT